jgi:triphosphoribosyl-dephospho-CoA synthase
LEVANRAATMARGVLSAGPPRGEAYECALADLDFWLRADGHRRNPGTTADLIAAGLFVALRDGIIKPPFRLAR